MDWKAGIYGRVSTEHEEQQESINIQKDALIQYARDNGIIVADCYFDEGYTGTNFNRPEFSRLRNDIDKGVVNLVITKDLSRIGRNNTMTLLFLDYLSEKNIRLIAINDDYDTLKDEDDLIGIKTWVNERYSKELSKKIRFALRHKKRKGEYLTAYPPYGYKKSASTNNKLEVDYYSAGVVKEIFRLYIEGNGFTRIAGMLDDKGVLNPSRYGCYGKKSDMWNWTTIKRIITNPVYTGDSVQQRYCKKTYKSKTITKAPKSQWIEVKNTHEPIISRETFELAGEILNKRKNVSKYRNSGDMPHLFSSFLYCHDCGSPLYYKKDKAGKGVYRCGSYVKYGRKGCSTHHVREDELKVLIYNELVSIIRQNINTETLFEDIKRFFVPDKRISLEKKLKLAKENVIKNELKLEVIYHDRLNGIIDENLYIKIKKEIEQLLQIQNEIIEDISKELSKCPECEDNSILKNKIEGITVLRNKIDRQILERFIKRIEVLENGEIILTFNFFLH